MTNSKLSGKRIIFGVTGSIAAVKAPIIARELVRAGAEVIPVLTSAAHQFTTPLALSSLTRSAAITEVFPPDKSSGSEAGTWHVHLARSAQAMLIAPCSATMLGKLRAGIYDDPVTLLASSLRGSTPLFLAPAMDEEMWLQPAVQENLEILKQRGARILGPVSGALASGLTGMGRMLEPVDIVLQLCDSLVADSPLTGKRVLITGGPTYEPIDPVRFIGNRASGKMAAALAHAAHQQGANVTLIMGPSTIATETGIERIDIETAEQMASAVKDRFPESDILIMNAAVSDFTPESVSDTKLKKRELDADDTGVLLKLKRTTDILSTLVKVKRDNQIVIGFALEKGNAAESYATGKLKEKQLDMVVLNNIDDAGAGFNHNTNKITIFTRNGERNALPLLSKEQCATEILSAAKMLL